MAVGFSNYAATTITDAGGITAGALAFTVASNAGMPSTLPFIARLTQYNANGDVIAYEFVRVTAQGGTGNRTWTITRAQESTVAIAHPQGTQVSNPLTAGVMNEDLIIIDSETYYDSTFKRLSLGSNSLLPSYRLEVGGSEANNTLGAGVQSRIHIYNRDLGAAGRLSELTYGGAINSSYATIDGYLQSAVGNTQGGVIISTRRLTADANPTEAMRISYTGSIGIKTAGEPTANTDLDVNGIVAVGNGSVTAPSYAFRGDLNTGIWWPQAEQLAISTNGQEHIRFYNSGGLNYTAIGFAATGVHAGGVLGVGTEVIIGTGTTASGLRSTINRYAFDVASGNNIVTDVYFNDVSGTPKRVAQLDVICDGANDAGKWVWYTTPTGGAVTARIHLNSSGHFYPNGNKTQDLGLTTNRWNIVRSGTADAVGTSRLCESILTCECGEQMYRGTGSHIILGEKEDYLPAFCLSCGNAKMEKISHFPRAMLAQRRPAPQILFNGITVCQVSGNSYAVRVDYIYGWKEQTELQMSDGIEPEPIQNSTVLGQTEIEYFFSLSSNAEKRAYLLELGQREWNAMEEARLMEEEVRRVQHRFDEAISGLAGINLLVGV